MIIFKYICLYVPKANLGRALSALKRILLLITKAVPHSSFPNISYRMISIHFHSSALFKFQLTFKKYIYKYAKKI